VFWCASGWRAKGELGGRRIAGPSVRLVALVEPKGGCKLCVCRQTLLRFSRAEFGDKGAATANPHIHPSSHSPSWPGTGRGVPVGVQAKERLSEGPRDALMRVDICFAQSLSLLFILILYLKQVCSFAVPSVNTVHSHKGARRAMSSEITLYIYATTMSTYTHADMKVTTERGRRGIESYGFSGGGCTALQEVRMWGARARHCDPPTGQVGRR